MQRYTRRIPKRLKNTGGALLAAIALAVIGIILLAPKAAKAQGLKDSVAGLAPKPAAFAGCGPSVRAGWDIGGTNTSPVFIGSEGGVAGVGIGCDYQASQHFLVGAFANYDWAFNDLHTLGVQHDLTIGGRVGLVTSKDWMPYLGLAWSRVDLTGGKTVDGAILLGGVEIRLATSAPLFFDVELDRGRYTKPLGSSVDINSTAVLGILKYKFGGQ